MRSSSQNTMQKLLEKSSPQKPSWEEDLEEDTPEECAPLRLMRAWQPCTLLCQTAPDMQLQSASIDCIMSD